MSCLLKVSKKLFPVVLLMAASVVFGEKLEVAATSITIPDPIQEPKRQHSNSHVLTITENKRLEASIALDAMNRLAVVNDRIVNIFGDEGTFVVQTDEHTGQVFIKPTAENGDKPLSITLITENGVTQDLTLNPTKLTATTLILKPSQQVKQYNSPAEGLLPGFTARNQTLQEQWIQIMKQAVLGELAVVETRMLPKARKVTGFNLGYEKSYQAGSLFVQVWTIKNSSKVPQELQEQSFFKDGDLALSLAKRLLQPNEKTFIYVLRDV